MSDVDTPQFAVQFLYRLYRRVLPSSRAEFARWTTAARQIPDTILATQAIASLEQKRFHADGGAVYAAVNPKYTASLVRLIFAFQTISDYLDNLCDRSGHIDELDFQQLHCALQDAIHPDAPLRPYYCYRGNPDDGGYLSKLVRMCQVELKNLPGYEIILPHLNWLVSRYCELQTLKHLPIPVREERLNLWWSQYQTQYPDIQWWEFSAATGSTLSIFALFLAATSPVTEDEAKRIVDSYFPWVCGLHILLDYLIDLEEDRIEGDFNFVACYASSNEARLRLRHFAFESRRRVNVLTQSHRIHADVVAGLLSMYLSDSKVVSQAEVKPARRLIWEFGPTTWLFYGACMIYRVIR